MLRTPVFAVFLSLAACVSTTPCPADTVEDPVLGCVPADAPVDGPESDGGNTDTGEFDAGCATMTFYADMDGDDHGDPAVTMEACDAPDGYVALNDDCDDTTELRYGGLAEVCDGLDNDCVGAADDTFACVQDTMTSCTTSCGSTGSTTCTSTCELALCTPPTETCNAVDDDCDGQVDQGLQTVGPELTVGEASGRVVSVATAAGHVVFASRPTGIYARLYDARGAALALEATVTTTSTEVFDAWSTGSEIVVAWLQGTSIVGVVFNGDLTTVSPSPITLVPSVDDFTLALRVVAASGRVIVVHNDSALALRAVRCAFPALTGCGAVTVASGYRVSGQLDMTVDPAGRAYLVYRATTSGAPTVAQIYVDSIPLSSGSSSQLTILGVNPSNYPTIHFASTPAGPRLAIAWSEDPTGTTSDRLRFALYAAPAGGVLSIRETLDVVPGYRPPVVPEPHAITSSGGRFFVSSLPVGTGTSSGLRVTEVIEPISGAVTFSTFDVATPPRENRTVSLSGGTGASVLVAASRTGGSGRAFVIGCP